MESVDYSAEAARVAEAFVKARRDGQGLSDYPGAVPPSINDAYRVQDAAIAIRDGVIGGWKVGRINPPVEGCNRLAGPIYTDMIAPAGADIQPMPVFEKGFAAAEAEFLLRIGRAPEPGKQHFTREEAIALIDAVHVGIEVASSPFSGINDFGAAVTISDFGNNNGLVVGSPIVDWADERFEHWPIRLLINGQAIGDGKAVDMLDGAIGAARFLFELMARRGITLQPGQWISSGAVTGVHPVKVGDRIEARFNDELSVACIIQAS